MNARTLPIRVGLLPGETIDSWLEAIAARHHSSWRDLLDAVGLPAPGSTVSSWIARPTLAETVALVAATSATGADIAAAALAHHDTRALRIDPISRTLDKTFPWSPANTSRFCPQCLSETGGRWQLSWRLGWSFACLRHHRLLAETCPGCGREQRHRPLAAEVVPVPGRCASPVPGAMGRILCGADLAAAETAVVFEPGHPVLAAQHTINTVIGSGTADFGVYAAAPQTAEAALTDIRAVAARVLYSATTRSLSRVIPADLLDVCLHGDAAPRSRTPTPTLLTAPAAPAAAVAVTATLAVLGAPDAHQGGQALHWLVAETRGSGAKPLACMSKSGTSPVVEAIELAASAPTMSPADQLRHRIAHPMPRKPGQGTTTRVYALTRAIPSMLWPNWSLRFALIRPQQRQLRPAISIALLLTATNLAIADAAEALGGYADNYQVNRALKLLVGSGQWHDIRHAFTRMSDYLADTDTPIDYQRRRRLDYTDLLPDDLWERICWESGAVSLNPGTASRARRYLFEKISGLPADAAPAAATDNPRFQPRTTDFVRKLTPELASALEVHAHEFLDAHDIRDEPPFWQPPTDLLDGLHLPGPNSADVDIDQLHHVVRHEGHSIGAAAQVLGTTPDTIRHVLGTCPAPFTPPAGDRGAASRAAKAALPPDTFVELYQRQRLSLAVIAKQAGTSPAFIKRLAHDYNIPIRPAHRQTPHIDANWLRQQYLVHGRSLTDLANETGATWAALTNCAQRHNIPLRRNDAYYSRRSPLTEAETEAAPPLLRSALAKMGGLGWLNDFATASSHPNLKVAAEHLGISRPLLSQRITELEAALAGEPLLTRARSGATMTLTPYGKAILDATKQIVLPGNPDRTD